MIRVIPCEEAARYVYRYLDGELEPKTEAEFLAHVRACRRCLGVVEFERRVLDFVKVHAAAGTESPAGLRGRVERILEEA